jgi:hypothetical protein
MFFSYELWEGMKGHMKRGASLQMQMLLPPYRCQFSTENKKKEGSNGFSHKLIGMNWKWKKRRRGGGGRRKEDEGEGRRGRNCGLNWWVDL